MTDPDPPSGPECPGCPGERLDVFQPRPAHPDRLLGLCWACGELYRVEPAGVGFALADPPGPLVARAPGRRGRGRGGGPVLITLPAGATPRAKKNPDGHGPTGGSRALTGRRRGSGSRPRRGA
jgi:hypothetical protein